MDAQLEDLRILRLAAMYEEAFESFVARMMERHLDGPTKARLAPLQPDRDQHAERIRALLARIERALPPDAEPALQRAILVDVVEVERAAREFYFNHLEDVHDPQLVRLFHELAAEEGKHGRIAEDALAALGPEPWTPPPSREPELPLWEGVTDLDPSREAVRRAQ